MLSRRPSKLSGHGVLVLLNIPPGGRGEAGPQGVEKHRSFCDINRLISQQPSRQPACPPLTQPSAPLPSTQPPAATHPSKACCPVHLSTHPLTCPSTKQPLMTCHGPDPVPGAGFTTRSRPGKATALVELASPVRERDGDS